MSDEVSLTVDPSGTPHLQAGDTMTEARSRWHQRVGADMVKNFLAPFSIEEGVIGPHLLAPAEGISIVPGKLSGEPHVQDTRIETRVLSALRKRGYRLEQLADLYPDASELAIRRALRLERQLQRNESRLAA